MTDVDTHQMSEDVDLAVKLFLLILRNQDLLFQPHLSVYVLTPIPPSTQMPVDTLMPNMG